MTQVFIVFRGLIAFKRGANAQMDAYLVNRRKGYNGLAWEGTENHDHVPRLEARTGIRTLGRPAQYSFPLERGSELTFGSSASNNFDADFAPLPIQGVATVETFEEYVPHLGWFFPDGHQYNTAAWPGSHQGRVVLPTGTLGASDLATWTAERHDEPSVAQNVEFVKILPNTRVHESQFVLAEICTLTTRVPDGTSLIVREARPNDPPVFYQVSPAPDGEVVTANTIELSVRNNSRQLPKAPPLSIHFKAFFDGLAAADLALFQNAVRPAATDLPSPGPRLQAAAEAEIRDNFPFVRLVGVQPRPRNAVPNGTQDRPLCIPIWG